MAVPDCPLLCAILHYFLRTNAPLLLAKAKHFMFLRCTTAIGFCLSYDELEWTLAFGMSDFFSPMK